MTDMAQASVNRWEHYYTPGSVAEALEILGRYDGEARVVGGGTDLLVETRRGMHKPVEAMVDADSERVGTLDAVSPEHPTTTTVARAGTAATAAARDLGGGLEHLAKDLGQSRHRWFRPHRGLAVAQWRC